MSTDHQKYSTENQADVIAAYAAKRNFEIVRSYADEGRSGLNIAGRDSLRRLISDVQNGEADYEAVLVYDISRWGRFQDADESAYYEFICRERGINVHYCAEQFDNDGSLPSNVMKSIKRVMAGEYSRELSSKVFAGQCRLITLGYRQGGSAGYGLRRHLVNEHNEQKAPLARGEHKSLQTDRVILVPGPDEEVETVRRIYRLFVLELRSEREIATILNQEDKVTDLGQPWSRPVVRQILSNEKYIGNNVYNRVSFKLKKKRVVNTPDMWVRGDGVFEAIVDPMLFEAAQSIFADRARRFSDEELLQLLSSLLGARGALSGMIIDEVDAMPSSAAYRHRFGSLLRAYELIGYTPARDYRYLETNRQLRLMHPEVVADTVAGIERIGGSVAPDCETDLLLVNHEVTLALVIVRCQPTPAGSLRWRVRLDAGLRPDITIVVRLKPGNKNVRDYYLLPWLDVGTTPRIGMAEENGVYLDAYRADDLTPLYHLLRRHTVERSI
ncbi:recombinase family protein [Sphingomonas psychrotolerans]|uniref:Recombinase family protein n=1 Tax=Sphingomonas psychrotolerans TaxID=1327635 RepID=A0A2K8MFU0_9SPHN|nr:recombinase family protein [Sphingomonas psychrotolerans]ATY30609.1 recombinase family protein [Sphingomonas psychrotolerans]